MGAGRELRAEIEIDADPGTVWTWLTTFEAYPDWNPFIRSIEGSPTLGSRLRVRLEPPGGKGITMRPVVTVHDAGRAFGWRGSLGGIPRLFDGAHRFDLEPIDEGRRTRLVQSERFGGILLPIVGRSVLPGTLAGFEAMHLALADRAATAEALG